MPSWLCTAISLRQLADFYGLGWHTLKAIDRAALQARLEVIGRVRAEIRAAVPGNAR